MMNELLFDDQLGWWLRQPDDEHRYAYRANIRGVFYGRKGSVVGVDLRSVQPGTTVTFTRCPSFIADADSAGTFLPRLINKRVPDRWGLRLEGRWGQGQAKQLVALAPSWISAVGARASRSATELAQACHPVAFAAHLDDHTFALLGTQPRLSALRLWYAAITDRSLGTVAGLSTLRELNVGNNAAITDAGIKQLAGLRRLTTLNLEQTALDDDSLATLATLPRLRSLLMARTRITDAGLSALRNHPSLETINVASNPITDTGIDHLATIPNLRSVVAYGTKVQKKKRYAFLR